jgi:hypothetical protein
VNLNNGVQFPSGTIIKGTRNNQPCAFFFLTAFRTKENIFPFHMPMQIKKTPQGMRGFRSITDKRENKFIP